MSVPRVNARNILGTHWFVHYFYGIYDRFNFEILPKSLLKVLATKNIMLFFIIIFDKISGQNNDSMLFI